MKNIVPVRRTSEPGREKKLVLGWLFATTTWMVAGVALFPMDIGIMVAGLALSLLFVIVGFIALVVAAAATKGDAISPGTGWVVGIVGFVLLVAGIAMYAIPPATTSSGGGGGSGGNTAMDAFIVPSVDTTASFPASPYTACTSLTLLGLTGQSGAGVVWTTSNGVYNPQNRQFKAMETLTTTVASGAASFLSAECFQMKFTFQYKQVPSVQGVKQAEPFLLKIDSITYTAPITNNGTAGNTAPVFYQMQSGSVQGDWLLLFRDDASAWHPACSEFSSQTSLGTGGCNWVSLGTNDGTAVDTVYFVVIINRIGPFGYDRSASPLGKVDAINFEIGMPLNQVGSTAGYYLPSTSYQLSIELNAVA